MARSRRGSFGLKPRVAPDVTGQIVALAREYQAKRDSVIMDSWRNGGMFEGKKTTDSMVLAYWQERGRGLDPQDPEYEQSKNQILQLQYGIEQSKADVLHVQGKLSDESYAQFFLRWAAKVPVNSEFYRTLQKDAAQLIEGAKTKSRAAAEKARTEAFNKFVQTTTASQIAIGDAMTKALDDLSKQTGLSITGNGDELLALLTQNVQANPGQYRVLLDTIKTADPQWNGQLTEGYFSQHIKTAAQGYESIADRAQKDGFVSAYASATQGMASMSSWGQNLRVWPVSQTYTQAENSFLKVWNDPTASQMDKTAAASAFSSAITFLSNTPGIDPGSRTMLQADAARLLGQDGGDGPSFGSSMLGRGGVDPTMSMQVGALQSIKTQASLNPVAWAYAPVDKAGQFDPTGQGSLGLVPAGTVQPGAQAVVVPGMDGKAVLAMVMPHSVYSSDPNNPSASPKLVGYQISYNIGGRGVQLWGYRDDHNANHWSLQSPVADGATTSIDNKGDVYITPVSTAITDPIARATQLDAQMGTHMADQLRANSSANGTRVTQNTVDKNGHVVSSVELSYNNGTFTATQTQNTLDRNGHVLSAQTTPMAIPVTEPRSAAFSPSRMSAGDIPGVTFSSPMQASVNATKYTQTTDQVSRFASDPAFQQAFLSQTMLTLGTENPYDGRIADAWQNIMTPHYDLAPTYAPSSFANNRTDLSYPVGVTNPNAYKGSLTIGFGTDSLKLPGLPSYVGNIGFGAKPATPNYAASLGPLGNLIPGLGATPLPGQTSAGSPALSVTPTQTPTPTPTPVTTVVPAAAFNANIPVGVLGPATAAPPSPRSRPTSLNDYYHGQ